MNKSDLTEIVSRVTCVKKEANDAVNITVSAIRNALKRGEKVTISGLGTFYTKMRKTKKGRNPKTGEVIELPPKKVVRFKPAKKILT